MKIEFFFTEGHSYTATNVFDIVLGVDTISYVREVQPHLNGVETTQSSIVSMDDLLYALVHHDYRIQVVPGIFSKFEIVPVGAEVVRQANIEREAQGVRNRQVLRKVKKDIKNREGFAARNAKRRAEYEQSLGATPTPEDVARAVNEAIEAVEKTLPEMTKAAKHLANRKAYKKQK